MPGLRVRAASVAAAMALIPVAAVTCSESAGATTFYYDTCRKMHADYKHGVAKSRKAALKQVRQGYGKPTYDTHARGVYWANKSRLDLDDDGTACEA